MTTSETFSTIISLIALFLSTYTAYRTILAKFRGEVLLKPRAVLTNFDEKPCIVVGCDISNLGATSGSIDDFILAVKYKQKASKSINSLTFLPLLIRDDYSVFQSYIRTDFEPFQSISIAKESRLTKYIVFTASDINFSPSPGNIELQLYFRNSNASEFLKVKRTLNFSISDAAVSIWSTKTDRSISLESQENDKFREKLMDAIF